VNGHRAGFRVLEEQFRQVFPGMLWPPSSTRPRPAKTLRSWFLWRPTRTSMRPPTKAWQSWRGISAGTSTCADGVTRHQTVGKWSRKRARSPSVLRHSAVGSQTLDQGYVMSAHNSTEVINLLTLKQAAQRLSICRRSLERLIVLRKFPRPVRIGRSVRIPESDVQIYVQKLLAVRGGGG
jgi:excisionase family DNA binding protein